MPHRVYVRPGKPKLQRQHPLARGLVIAATPGWERGYDPTPANLLGQGPAEDAHGGQRGDNGHTQFGTLPTGTNYEHQEQYGNPSLEDGSPAATFLEFERHGDTRFSFTNAGGLSAFVLCRPESAGLDAEVIWKMRATPLGVANNGWDIRFGTANVFQANVCDGVTEIKATGVTVPSFAVGSRENVVVGFTWDLVTLRLYVDGHLDASIACALAIGSVSNLQTPKLFGTGIAATDFSDVAVGMNAFWNRALAPSEIAAMNVDPFRMWRSLELDEGIASFQTYLNAF